MTAKTTFINPFATGNFAQNRVLKLFVAKERKLTTKPFAGRCRAFRGLLIKMQHTARPVGWFLPGWVLFRLKRTFFNFLTFFVPLSKWFGDKLAF